MAHFDKEELEGIKPGPILWAASHPVAANLMMLIFLLGGLFAFFKTTKEVFPAFAFDSVTVQMSYPGASPAEVEQGIVLSVEDAIRNIEGIGEVLATAREGSGSVVAEILDLDEKMRVLQDVKTAVDQITTFPVDAEDLSVFINKEREEVLNIIISGDVDERVLRSAAEQARDLLDQNSDIGPVELSGARDYEIHIEVSQENLRRYKLSLSDISNVIRKTALELGGGSLDTQSGEILVRMSERRDYAGQFKDIPIITRENGSQVLLGSIADIKEGFDDSNNYAFFNGEPAIMLAVFRVGKQTPTGVSKAVQEQLVTLNASLPGDLKSVILNDRSVVFEQRAALLMKNGLFGLMLVIGFLALFLDVRLAFWVSMGIPISFLGAFLLFPATDFTVNMVTMFAFLISLGIVVDDAIVSGENIYHYRQKGLSPLKAAVTGAREMAVPVSVSVLTNMVAFAPLFFVPGYMGKIFGVIPVVVLAAFLMSLIESLFILPAHLTFKKSADLPSGVFKHFIRGQKIFSERFQNFIKDIYGPALHSVIHYRYLALAVFLAIFVAVGGYVLSGRMGMVLFPSVESDFSFAEATLKVGAPLEEMKAVEETLIKAARAVIEDNGNEALSDGIYSYITENKINIISYLTDPDMRPITTKEFTEKWREELKPMAGLESLSLQSDRGGPGAGAALTVELSHSDTDILDESAIKLAEALAEFPNTKDIDDGSAQGKKQYDFKMTDLGYTLGLTTQDVARQVRASFYGSEVFKQQRGRNEVRVLVRLPTAQRSSQYYLKNLIIHAPDGSEVLLRDVVSMEEGRAYTTINRRDGRRVIKVEADVDPRPQAAAIIATIKKDTLPALQQRYPGLSYSFEGQQADMRKSMLSLFMGLIAVLFVMYAILAILFSSYVQPFMVLIAIPFSAIGAVFGHFIMGYSLSMVSMFGLMALSGVVVNDSLILIDYANKKRKEGMSLFDAIIQAGLQRFRPIILTTLTTFVGLAPMIFETSMQARFLIPMAVSLGFGILFATFLTLILIPALYMIIEDFKKLLRRMMG